MEVYIEQLVAWNTASTLWLYQLGQQSAGVMQLLVYFDFVIPALYLLLLFILGYFSMRTHYDSWRAWQRIFKLTVPVLSLWFLAHGIKFILATPRPFELWPEVHALFAASGAGFPSGHTIFFAALGFFLWVIDRRVSVVTLLFAVATALSRVMAGVHFTFDVIGSFALAALTLLLIWPLYRYMSIASRP